MGKKVLKLLAGLGVLWSVTKTLLEWLGNIDFIAESLNELGWIREVYTFLANPSPTSTLLVFSISLSLFGFLRYYEKKEKGNPPIYNLARMVKKNSSSLAVSEKLKFFNGDEFSEGSD